MTTNSEIIRDSQDFILVIRIFINLFFLIMILLINIIITINNNNNSNNYKLFKNNNIRYLKLVDFYKSSTKTQTSFLNKINLVNKTQTSTIIMIIKIRSNFTTINFNDDLLLKHINIMLKIKKTNHR